MFENVYLCIQQNVTLASKKACRVSPMQITTAGGNFQCSKKNYIFFFVGASLGFYFFPFAVSFAGFCGVKNKHEKFKSQTHLRIQLMAADVAF